jgi:hypothetical protein
VDTLRAAHVKPDAKALVAKGMKGGAMLAAGIPPPSDATLYALVEALTARVGSAHEWSVSAGESAPADTRTITASILREAPRQEEGQSAMYRLILTCNPTTGAGEIRLSWSPIPATTTLVAAVDERPGIAYRIEGTETMGNGSPSANPASAVLADSNAPGSSTIVLPRRALKVTGVFADTVEFPFANLPQDVRQATASCFTP